MMSADSEGQAFAGEADSEEAFAEQADLRRPLRRRLGRRQSIRPPRLVTRRSVLRRTYPGIPGLTGWIVGRPPLGGGRYPG